MRERGRKREGGKEEGGRRKVGESGTQSLRAVTSIGHTQHGDAREPLSTSASVAELGHFLSWKLKIWGVSAPFLDPVLVSAPAQPGRAAGRLYPQRRLGEGGGAEGKGCPGV